MFKKIVIVALLLPFSGYATSRKARIKEIETTIDRLNQEQEIILTGFMLGFPLNILTQPTEEIAAFRARLEKYIEQIDSLNKEYSDLNQSLDK